jgi:hypothetical protein
MHAGNTTAVHCVLRSFKQLHASAESCIVHSKALLTQPLGALISKCFSTTAYSARKRLIQSACAVACLLSQCDYREVRPETVAPTAVELRALRKWGYPTTDPDNSSKEPWITACGSTSSKWANTELVIRAARDQAAMRGAWGGGLTAAQFRYATAQNSTV